MRDWFSNISPHHRGPGAQRGLALVTVLWVLMLLSLVAASFMATTRLEINLTRNLIENAKAEALANAGVCCPSICAPVMIRSGSSTP